MTSRADRIRKAVPGLAEEDISTLASLGQAELTVVVKALRQARRDALAEAADRKRQQKADRRRQPGWYDDNYKVADYADELFRKSLVPRAGRNLMHLARLKQHYDDAPAVLSMAVAGARAQGYSDTEIAMALGHEKAFARQAVGQRFGRRNAAGGCSDDHYSRPDGAGELTR